MHLVTPAFCFDRLERNPYLFVQILIPTSIRVEFPIFFIDFLLFLSAFETYSEHILM